MGNVALLSGEAVQWDGEAMTMSAVPPLKTSTAAMRPLRSWPGASVMPLPWVSPPSPPEGSYVCAYDSIL